MDKTLDIFLSSTIDDMQEERNAVTEVINSLKMLVTRSEFFDARKESPRNACLLKAKECDIYIGLFKNRYGFVPTVDNPDKISVTHMEYLQAKKENKEIAIFISADSENREHELVTFLDQIRNFDTGHLVKKYRNIDELKSFVFQSLYGLRNKPDITTEEINVIESFSSDISRYNKILLREFKHSAIRGIARNYNIKPFEINDLFVPPELLNYDDNRDGKDNDNWLSLRRLSIVELNPYAGWVELIELHKPAKDKSITKEIDLYQKLYDQKTTVILGPPGSGKSTLVKFLLTEIIQHSNIISIFIQIREFVSFVKETNSESVINFINKQYKGITESFFSKQLESGSCLIIFDGLDEVWNSEDRNRMNKILEKFIAAWSPENKVIITSRPHSYSENPLSGNLEVLKIGYFKSTQIEQFIRNWAVIMEKNKEKEYDNTEVVKLRNNIISALSQSDELIRLSKSPLLLLIICLIYSENKSFPKGKTQLYEMLIETLASSWEKSKGLKLEKYGWRDIGLLLKEIAYKMFMERKTEISLNEVFEIIKQKLISEGLTNTTNKDVEEIIEYLEERSGILKNDGFHHVSFHHLSFQEYFVALSLCEKYNITQIFQFLQKHLHNSSNSEIISFTAGSLTNRILTSNFLELVLMAGTKYEDIHLMDLILVLSCISNGAFITDEFSTTVFQFLEKKWDVDRSSDIEFFDEVANLLNTPHRDQVVSMWRKKYHVNHELFLNSSLSPLLFSQNENIQDFEYFWKCLPDLAKKTFYYSPYFIIEKTISLNPSREPLNFLKNHLFELEQNPGFAAILQEMADIASSDKEMEEWFLEKIKSNNTMVKMDMIRLIPKINPIKANEFVSSIINNTKSTIFESKINELCSRTKRDTINLMISDLEKILSMGKISKEEQNKLGIDIMWMIIQGISEERFRDKILETIQKLPADSEILVFRIFRGIEMALRDSDKLEYLQLSSRIINSNDGKFTRWKKHYQGLKLLIHPNNDDCKNILIENTLDVNLFAVERRWSFHTLEEKFKNDGKVKNLAESLINDYEMRNVAITKLDNDQLPKHNDGLVQMYLDASLKESRYAILLALRRSISVQ